MANALTTKARIKDRLQLTTTSFDDLFDRLIAATTARIERMTNRSLLLATYTNELYDGSDIYGSLRSLIITKNAPVKSISSIQYKSGLNSDPTWRDYDEDDYDVDLASGIIYFKNPLPRGKQNIRITYTAGYDGSIVGLDAYWVFNATPTGTVDGSNTVFTLPEVAEQVVVYADGLRIAADNYTFTENTDTITFEEGSQPFSSIAVDYKPGADNVDATDPDLPLELVEVCEVAVIRLFKKRDSEGKTTETFNESQITWQSSTFTKEDLATINNYRRSSFL